jgi:predicted membrane protein
MFVLWSLIPIVFWLACFLFSVTSNSNDKDANSYKALFLFLGPLLLIPSTVVLILGLILIPDCSMPCYFSGTEWW